MTPLTIVLVVGGGFVAFQVIKTFRDVQKTAADARVIAATGRDAAQSIQGIVNGTKGVIGTYNRWFGGQATDGVPDGSVW